MALLNAAQSNFDMRSTEQSTSAPEGSAATAATVTANVRRSPAEKPTAVKCAAGKHQEAVEEVTAMLLAVPRFSKHEDPPMEYALHTRSSLERQLELASCGIPRLEAGSTLQIRQILKVRSAYIQVSKIRAEYADRIPVDSELISTIREACATLEESIAFDRARSKGDVERGIRRTRRHVRLLHLLRSIATELEMANSAPVPSTLQSDTPPAANRHRSTTKTKTSPMIEPDHENTFVPRKEPALKVDAVSSKATIRAPPTSAIPRPTSKIPIPTSTQPLKSDVDEPRAWLRVLLPHVLIRQTNAAGQLHDEVLAFHSSLQDLLFGLLKIKFGDTLAVAACMEDLPTLLSVSTPEAKSLDLPSATSAMYWASLSRHDLHAQYKAAGDILGHELRKWGDIIYAKYFISARMTKMTSEKHSTLAKDVRHLHGPGLQKDARFGEMIFRRHWLWQQPYNKLVFDTWEPRRCQRIVALTVYSKASCSASYHKSISFAFTSNIHSFPSQNATSPSSPRSACVRDLKEASKPRRRAVEGTYDCNWGRDEEQHNRRNESHRNFVCTGEDILASTYIWQTRRGVSRTDAVRAKHTVAAKFRDETER